MSKKQLMVAEPWATEETKGRVDVGTKAVVPMADAEMKRSQARKTHYAPLPAKMGRAARLAACGITLDPKCKISPAATYLVSEVATMLGQSTATVRRLLTREKLERARGLDVVRITNASFVKMLSAAASEPVNLARELDIHGPCLVVGPDDIAKLFRIHVQTAYRNLARGKIKCLPWLTNRCVLKSEVAKLFGANGGLEELATLSHDNFALAA
jgi:hypothetical protein